MLLLVYMAIHTIIKCLNSATAILLEYMPPLLNVAQPTPTHALHHGANNNRPTADPVYMTDVAKLETF